jgi:hypothetical protein
MGTVYVMNLEDRVDLARNQLDLVIRRLQSLRALSPPDEIEQTLSLAASQLQRICELIGR